VNGKPADSAPLRDDGLIVVPVPQGPVEVKVDWAITADVIAGRCLSCAAALLLIGLALVERRLLKAQA
jgi:predicted Kef-type K+ transport protein